MHSHPTSLAHYAALLALAPIAWAAPSTSYNTGSLGTAGDGANSTDVLIDQPGVLAAGGDYSSQYGTGNNTTVPFLSELNPAAASPFTIEFWAKPTATDNDDAPISNRLGGGGNRSGWVFFQRNETTGWNFRMYNGNGGGLGWDITGGTATLNAWSHVVVVWNGSSASLYVNGQAIPTTNSGNGVYNPNTTENFYVGALIGGGSPSTGYIDEVAYYPTALTGTQILNHYNTASSTVIGAYSAMVIADGAVEYLQQNPPVATITSMSPSPVIKFTGILSQSEDLDEWTDLAVTSPYTVPAGQPKTLFFRSHRPVPVAP
jgi:hypothetical protein